MFKLKLRSKLIIYSIALAIIPLGIAGQTMIQITQDELKSSVNDRISDTIAQISNDIDELYADTWLAPLMLITRGVENESLSVDAKIAIIKAGIENIVDVAACQISIMGASSPIIITKDALTQHLAEFGLDPAEILQVDSARLAALAAASSDGIPPDELQYVETSDDWFLSVMIPLRSLAAGQQAFFIATIDLKRLRNLIVTHPFNRIGRIMAVDRNGRQLLDPLRRDLNDLQIVHKATQLMDSSNHTIGVTPYVRPDGETRLAGFSFPKHFDMAVIVEQSEQSAYAAIEKMMHILTKLIIAVLAVTIIGAILFSLRISRPVEEIASVAQKVQSGDLLIRVSPLKTKDEIGILATRMNDMISGLRERDRIRSTFGRYMSDDVVKAILESPDGAQIGGEKRDATIVMTDLRGFTSMGERLEAEDVVTILNIYLETMTDIILQYKGTIVAFMGDAILTIFGAPIAREDDAPRAVACAVAMQLAIQKVNERCHAKGFPALQQGIGINTGKVVVGNIGSDKQMKYDCIGRNVNLASRIESYTVGGQILISESTHAACPDILRIDGQTEVFPKGFQEPIQIYDVGGVGGAYNVHLPPRRKGGPPQLERPIAIEFNIFKGKETGAAVHTGTIIGLAQEEAHIRSSAQLQRLDNLRIQLFDHDNHPITTDLIAKVTEIPETLFETPDYGYDTEKLTVLLVDDQPLIGMTMKRMLAKEADIDFHYCDDPTRAIPIANEICPAVILQDLVMPQIDGWELLQAFRKNRSTQHTPLIVLSTTEEPLAKSKAFAQGAVDYMVKLPHQLEVVARIRYHGQAYMQMAGRHQNDFTIYFTSTPPAAERFLRSAA